MARTKLADQIKEKEKVFQLYIEEKYRFSLDTLTLKQILSSCK